MTERFSDQQGYRPTTAQITVREGAPSELRGAIPLIAEGAVSFQRASLPQGLGGAGGFYTLLPPGASVRLRPNGTNLRFSTPT